MSGWARFGKPVTTRWEDKHPQWTSVLERLISTHPVGRHVISVRCRLGSITSEFVVEPHGWRIDDEGRTGMPRLTEAFHTAMELGGSVSTHPPAGHEVYRSWELRHGRANPVNPWNDPVEVSSWRLD